MTLKERLTAAAESYGHGVREACRHMGVSTMVWYSIQAGKTPKGLQLSAVEKYIKNSEKK